MDPHHLDVDPDADLDSAYPQMLIRIRLVTLMQIRIRLIILMRIYILASKKWLNPWKSAKIGSYSIRFGLSSAN